MINKDKEALLFVKDFCKTFYYKRNVEESLKYLSDKIIWTGPNKKIELSNYEKLKAIFSVDVSLISSPFNIYPISEITFEVTPDVFNINYSFKLLNKKTQTNIEINLFATVKYTDNKAQIVSAKFDYIKSPDFLSNSFIQHARGGLLVATYLNKNYFSIKFTNTQFNDLFNFTETEAINLYKTNLLDYILDENIENTKQIFYNNLNSNTPFTCNFKVKWKDFIFVIIATVISKKEKDEINYYFIIRPHINVDNEPNCLIKEMDKTNIALNNNNTDYLIDGTHKHNYNTFLLEDISDNLCKLLNYNKTELLKYTKHDFKKLIHEDDYSYFEKIYNKLHTQRPKYSFSYRLISKDKKVFWVNERLEIITDKNGDKHIFAIIRKNDNLTNSNIFKNNEKIFLPPSFNSNFLIIDLVKNQFETSTFNNSSIKFTNKYVNDLPNSLIENNYIYEDDISSFIKFYYSILNNKKNTWTGRIKQKNNRIGWYNIISYTLFNNKMPIKALCTIINIDNKKIILDKFQKQQEIIKLIISDYEFIGEYDLFNNIPIFLYSPICPNDFYENENISNFEFFLNNAVFKDDITKLLKIRNDNIEYIYNNKIPQSHNVDIRYRSLSNRFSGYQWCNMKYIYKLDEKTKHLQLILFIKNINKSKMNELTLLENLKNTKLE